MTEHELKVKYPKIQVGEYLWQGNLEEFFQRVRYSVYLPYQTLTKKMNGKMVIESCLVSKKDNHEQDHSSIRMQSIQEGLSHATSTFLMIKQYARNTNTNKAYLRELLKKRIDQVWEGDFDHMVRRT